MVGVTAGALSADLLGRGRKVPFIEGMKYVEIIAVFTTEYFISGLAPYGDALVVLAYVPPGETASKGQSKVTTEKQVEPELPCCWFSISGCQISAIASY